MLGPDFVGPPCLTVPDSEMLRIDAHSASRIFNEGAGAVLTLSGLTLKNGTATAGVGGGAIATSGDLNVDKSEFVGNTTADWWGGAIIGNPAPTITITNSAFKTNSATSHGGGAFYNGGATTLTNDTFSGNTAGWGGAIQQSYLAMTVTNTTISGNSSTNVTFHGGGGLIDGGGTLTFKNSIVSGNSAASGEANCAIGYPTGTLVDGGYNIENGTSCGFTIGNHSLNADPLLRALANYGGPTDTMALQPGSPAKDSAGPGCPANDQRGQPRNTDGQCDRGAYEFVLPVVSSVSAATATCVTPGQSVTVNGIGFTFATSVTFGSTAATSFTVNSDSKITAVAPAGSGTADITVTSADGTSATTSADQVGLGACPTTPAPPPALPKAGHGSAPALGAAWLVIALGVLALATGFGVARHAGGNRS